MKQIIFLLLISYFLFTSLLGAETSVDFVISGDLRGEIRPCGCAEEGDMGGLLRRGSILTQWRRSSPHLLYFDLGNNFSPPSEQGKLKNKLIQQVMLQQLKPDVILVGPNELKYGIESLHTELPYLISNSEQFPFLQTWTQPIGKQIVSIWGYLSPLVIYQNEKELPLAQAVTPNLLESWKKRLHQEKSDVKLLLFRGNEKELEQFAKANLFDRIVVGSTNNDELHQILEMQTTDQVFQMIPTKGQGLFHGTWKQKTLGVTWLRINVPDDPQIIPAFAQYNAHVKALFLNNMKTMAAQRKTSPYVGNDACKTCHAAAFKIWRQSSHSHAFQTLANKGKQYDPECLQCHVVGMKNNGFLSAQLTPQLKNVQCENCHGPARQHLSNPLQHPLQQANKACTTCHQGSHSPTFRFADYWSRIRH